MCKIYSKRGLGFRVGYGFKGIACRLLIGNLVLAIPISEGFGSLGV